jgi:hypothetical protein
MEDNEACGEKEVVRGRTSSLVEEGKDRAIQLPPGQVTSFFMKVKLCISL